MSLVLGVGDDGLMTSRIVRMSSWGDRITISGEWRGCDYDRGMVEGFLEDVRGIMLSVLE